MTAKRVFSVCECKGYIQPTSFHVTSNLSLLVQGVCASCGSLVATHFPLAGLLGIASRMRMEVVCEQTEATPASDEDFLKEMKISGGLQ